MRKMFDKSQKLKERPGVIIAIEFCGYPRQTRTIWSAHPTAEYLSGVCLMHKQFPCRRRHRQLPIITHLRSRGWTIVVSSNKLGFRVLFKGIKDTRDREPLREDFCSAKRILYVWNRRQRKKEKETKAPGLSTQSCTIAFGCLEGFAATIYPRSTWEDTPEVGDIRSHTAEEHGFTMKFDWHLTVVQLIMVEISYYEISKALNAIRASSGLFMRRHGMCFAKSIRIVNCKLEKEKWCEQKNYLFTVSWELSSGKIPSNGLNVTFTYFRDRDIWSLNMVLIRLWIG